MLLNVVTKLPESYHQRLTLGKAWKTANGSQQHWQPERFIGRELPLRNRPDALEILAHDMERHAVPKCHGQGYAEIKCCRSNTISPLWRTTKCCVEKANTD